MKIKGYIFDIDHTLLNSDKAHIEAALESFEKFGIKRTYDQIIQYFDKATDEIFRLVTGNDYHDSNEIAEEKTKILNYRIREDPSIVPLYENVREIFSKLCHEDFKIGIVSNNYNSVIDAIIDSLNWNEYIGGYVGIDDVKKRKPHPEMVIKMVEKLDLLPKECVMVGDSIYDVQAGNKAGCMTVAVCTGHFTHKQFNEYNPNIILNNVGELLNLIPLEIEASLF